MLPYGPPRMALALTGLQIGTRIMECETASGYIAVKVSMKLLRLVFDERFVSSRGPHTLFVFF